MSLLNTTSLIKDLYSDSVLNITHIDQDFIVHIKGKAVEKVLGTLKEEGFNFLSDITAIDNLTLGGFERFVVVYHLLSHNTGERISVKAYVPEDQPSISSVESLWKTANWQEREIYDLFGIEFEGHPDLSRIFLPDDYQGHPLRKDYPKVGHGERRDFPIVERRIGSKSPRK